MWSNEKRHAELGSRNDSRAIFGLNWTSRRECQSSFCPFFLGFFFKFCIWDRRVYVLFWWNICWLLEIFQIHHPPTSLNERTRKHHGTFRNFPGRPPPPPFSKKILFISLPSLKIFWNSMIFLIKKYHVHPSLKKILKIQDKICPKFSENLWKIWIFLMT